MATAGRPQATQSQMNAYLAVETALNEAVRIRPGETEQAADRRFGTFLEGILHDKDTQPATKVTAHLILAVAKSAGVREQEKSLEKAKAHLEATLEELHKAIAVDFGDAMDAFLRNAKRRREELLDIIRKEEQEANGSAPT